MRNTATFFFDTINALRSATYLVAEVNLVILFQITELLLDPRTKATPAYCKKLSRYRRFLHGHMQFIANVAIHTIFGIVMLLTLDLNYFDAPTASCFTLVQHMNLWFSLLYKQIIFSSRFTY